MASSCTIESFAGKGLSQAEAYAYYACQYFEAVSANATQNYIIAGIQQAASMYFADKQYDIAKQAQDRLDDTWADQKDKSGKLFDHWYSNSRPKEIEFIEAAQARMNAGYTVDYETVKNRAVADVRAEYAKAEEEIIRTSNIHCKGATDVALRNLRIAQANAIVAATNQAYRLEENRKDLKEAQYREEAYKSYALFQGKPGESLNAIRGAQVAAVASSKIDPYAGWATSVGMLSNLSNAVNTSRLSGANLNFMQSQMAMQRGFRAGAGEEGLMINVDQDTAATGNVDLMSNWAFLNSGKMPSLE